MLLLHYTSSLDSIQRSELNKRDGNIKELTEKFTTEHKLRVKAEQERDQLKQTMVGDVATCTLNQLHSQALLPQINKYENMVSGNEAVLGYFFAI